MLAGALCRLAADVPRASPHNVPQLARHLERVLVIRTAAESFPARTLSRAYAYARSYATTTRATKPTATVKKAVKAAASEKTPPKKKAAPAKTKTTAKKPAAKKPKKKKKPAAKKPAAKKKAAPKRAKKAPTEEEKVKAKIRELRVKALKEPVSQKPVSAYNLFVAEFTSGKTGDGETQVSKITNATHEYKKLSPAQIEHYNHLANERNAARKAEFDKWIRSYTPQQIRSANLARNRLRKLLANTQKSGPAHTSRLHDDRHVKGTPNPYALFFRARHATGDFKGIAVTEAAKLIANEWKALSDGEKQKYRSEANAMAAKQ